MNAIGTPGYIPAPTEPSSLRVQLTYWAVDRRAAKPRMLSSLPLQLNSLAELPLAVTANRPADATEVTINLVLP